MYRCQDCGKFFKQMKIINETHGLNSPPYEKRGVCVFCGSDAITEEAHRYCRCCGARLFDQAVEYCNNICRARGQRLWEEERRRYRREILSPISKTVRDVETYNKEHGTNLSYGQYVAYVLPGIRRKKK